MSLINLETGARHDLYASDEHEHIHADGTHHTHSHDDGHHHQHDDHHDHDHAHDHHQAHAHAPAVSVVDLNTRILAKNDEAAARNRAWLKGREIFALNLMSAPGAGKTTLLERTVGDLKGRQRIYVLEGDQATDNDGQRIKAAGAPAVQINTGQGCHLDAEMLARGLVELKPSAGSVLFIENVGNLVCPALFDLGEAKRVAILSVTEGDDKPLKYPHMFRAADLMLLNKIDLLPYVRFDAERAIAHAREINPDIAVLKVSAQTGEGLDQWFDWIGAGHSNVAAGAFS
jgi:hydrogenase nickel incorporation protein HypB